MTNDRFIMAGGCALRVRESGEGSPTVVLIHGYLESLDVWEDFQKNLSHHLRVVSLDLPGHGISEVKGEVHSMEFMADTVHAALETLGVGKTVITGHSMGGYVALEYLRKYPESVSGIALFHSGPNADSEEKRADREREISLILGGKKELIARMFPQVGFAPGNRKRLAGKIEELADQITLTEDEGIIAALRGMAERRDSNEVLRLSKVPQLVIFGRHDEYISPGTAEAAAKEHPQAHVAWLENSGHMGFVEEPDKSLEIMLDFLKTLPPEEKSASATL